MMHRRTHPRETIAIALLSAAPFIALVWMCASLYVDVPFWDQWELVPRLQRFHSGALTLGDVWGQHNEQRPALPILLMLVLATVSKWRIGWEIAVNVLAGLGIFLVFAVHLRAVSRAAGARMLWMLPVVSLLVFSPAQWENWTFGWQMATFIGVLTTIGGFRLLSNGRPDRGYFVAAQVCGVVSTYSYVCGLVYWTVGFGVMALTPVHHRKSRLASWVIVAGLTIGSYFYDYHAAAGNPPMLAAFASLEGVLRLAIYIATYLGSPLGAYDQRAAAILGGLVVIACAGLLVRLRSSWREPAFVLPAALVLQTLVMAGLAALGRASMGTNQAMAPRYTTVSMPIWVAALMLAALALHKWTTTPARVRTAWAIAGPLVLALATTSIASGLYGFKFAAARSADLRPARVGLIVGRSAPLLLRLYPDLAVIQQRRVILLRLRTSVFRDTERSY